MADIDIQEKRARKELSSGLVVTWVGLVLNVLLVAGKIMAGLAARSQALVADGIHSMSDLFTDIIVLIGLKFGRKGEDENHPFGHARIETIASMLVGATLFVVGLGIAYNAVTSIYDHRVAKPGLLAIVVAMVSIVLKEAMYWYTLSVGKKIKSLAVIGNAWHHRSDALSSVAVLLGVTAAYIDPSWHLADAYAALVVTFFICKVGFSMSWEALKQVVDTAPSKKVLDQLVEIASQIDGVLEVHDVRARYSGSQIFVEMHIVVNPNLSVRDGHRIAATAEARLINEVSDVSRVIVHVDPEPKEE